MANEPIRRVITGHDGNSVAKVIREGPAANTKRRSSYSGCSKPGSHVSSRIPRALSKKCGSVHHLHPDFYCSARRLSREGQTLGLP